METRKYNSKDKDEVQRIFSTYWTDKGFLNELEEKLTDPSVQFYVAESDGEVVGIAGFRKAPEHLYAHATTKSPVELYVIASKIQNKGIGNIVGQRIIEEAKKLHFTEIECYSPDTHNASWKFYEKLGFSNRGVINDPDDGFPGVLWVKIID